MLVLLGHMLALSLLGATPSAPGSGLPEAVQALLDEAEYQRARRQMDRLLRNRALPTDERVALYAAHAVCDVSLGDDAMAEQSFQKVLTLQPDYRADPNRTSPKVLEVYELVRSRMQEQGALDSAYQSEFQPVADVLAGEPVTVKVAFKAEAAGAIARVFIRFRRVGEPNFESAELAAVEGAVRTWAGAIPAGFLTGDEDEYAVDYFLDALGAEGERLTGVGTQTLPLQFRVNKKESLVAGQAVGGGGAQAMKVVNIVVPIVIGVGVVITVASVTGVILALTALDPGASHLFLRRFQ